MGRLIFGNHVENGSIVEYLGPVFVKRPNHKLYSFNDIEEFGLNEDDLWAINARVVTLPSTVNACDVIICADKVRVEMMPEAPF